MAAIVGYQNPFPTFAVVFPAPFQYGPSTGIGQALRWGLSRGITKDVLQLLSITPTSGTAAGGTPVILRGNGFRKGATVTAGGVPMTSVIILNSKTILAVTGAHTAGAVNVVVTNPGGATSTLVNGYTYT
jgi:IPT/TIG domain